jgi:hypothetical protein
LQSHRSLATQTPGQALSGQQVRGARSPSLPPDTRPTDHVSSHGETAASAVVCAQPLHLSASGIAAAPAGPLFGRLPSSTELPCSASNRAPSELPPPAFVLTAPVLASGLAPESAEALRVAQVCTLPLLSFGGQLTRRGTSEQFRQRCPLSSGTPDEPSLGLTIRIVLEGPGPRLAFGGGDRHGD